MGQTMERTVTVCENCRYKVLAPMPPAHLRTEEQMRRDLMFMSPFVQIRYALCSAQPRFESEEEERFYRDQKPDLVTGERPGKPEHRFPLCSDVNDGACVFFSQKKPLGAAWAFASKITCGDPVMAFAMIMVGLCIVAMFVTIIVNVCSK